MRRDKFNYKCVLKKLLSYIRLPWAIDKSDPQERLCLFIRQLSCPVNAPCCIGSNSTTLVLPEEDTPAWNILHHVAVLIFLMNSYEKLWKYLAFFDHSYSNTDVGIYAVGRTAEISTGKKARTCHALPSPSHTNRRGGCWRLEGSKSRPQLNIGPMRGLGMVDHSPWRYSAQMKNLILP